MEALTSEVASLRAQAHHDMILDLNSDKDKVLQYTQGLIEKVEAAKETASRINHFQQLFKVEESLFLDLDDCSEDIQLRHQLWSCRQSWAALTQSWLSTRLDSIDVASMEEHVSKYHKAVLKMERGLVPNKVVPLLRETVNSWRGELITLIRLLISSTLLSYLPSSHMFCLAAFRCRNLPRGVKLEEQVLARQTLASSPRPHRPSL